MDLVVQPADELLAAMPRVLGFKPEESIILISFGCGLPITRVDFPTSARDRDEVWDAIGDVYARHARPGARIGIVCITEDRRNAELASQHLATRLETIGIATHLRLWADGERWREFNTGATGLQTQATAERIAGKIVLTGCRPTGRQPRLPGGIPGRFRPEGLRQAFAAAGLTVIRTWSDPERDFALSLSREEP
jgi:hypothetical protein